MADIVKPIILLSGPVGAGKTTIARELVAQLPGPLTYIEGDKFWSFIAKGEGIALQRMFKMTMTSMIAAAIPYSLHGFSTLVDFSIPPWFLEKVRKMTEPKGIPLDFAVIKPSEAVCRFRAANRAEGVIGDYSEYSEFYRDFGAADRHLIEDEKSSPAELAAIIAEGVNSGRFRIDDAAS